MTDDTVAGLVAEWRRRGKQTKAAYWFRIADELEERLASEPLDLVPAPDGSRVLVASEPGANEYARVIKESYERGYGQAVLDQRASGGDERLRAAAQPFAEIWHSAWRSWEKAREEDDGDPSVLESWADDDLAAYVSDYGRLSWSDFRALSQALEGEES